MDPAASEKTTDSQPALPAPPLALQRTSRGARHLNQGGRLAGTWTAQPDPDDDRGPSDPGALLEGDIRVKAGASRQVDSGNGILTTQDQGPAMVGNTTWIDGPFHLQGARFRPRDPGLTFAKSRPTGPHEPIGRPRS